MKHHERHLLKVALRRQGHQDHLHLLLEQAGCWKQALAQNLRQTSEVNLHRLVQESVALEVGLHGLKLILDNPPHWERIKQEPRLSALGLTDLLVLEGRFTQVLALGLTNAKAHSVELSQTAGSLEGALNFLRKDLAEEKLWKNLRYLHLQHLAHKLGLIKGVA